MLIFLTTCTGNKNGLKKHKDPPFLNVNLQTMELKAATCPQQTEIIRKLFNELFNLLQEALLQLLLQFLLSSVRILLLNSRVDLGKLEN